MAAQDPLRFAIRGPIRRDDLPGLCDRVCELLHGGATEAYCEVHGVEPDAVTVDALARLHLAGSRLGCSIHLVGAAPALLDLVDYMGLGDVLRREPR
jgi:ABC-type transporter Mla MlaB component